MDGGEVLTSLGKLQFCVSCAVGKYVCMYVPTCTARLSQGCTNPPAAVRMTILPYTSAVIAILPLAGTCAAADSRSLTFHLFTPPSDKYVGYQNIGTALSRNLHSQLLGQHISLWMV